MDLYSDGFDASTRLVSCSEREVLCVNQDELALFCESGHFGFAFFHCFFKFLSYKQPLKTESSARRPTKAVVIPPLSPWVDQTPSDGSMETWDVCQLERSSEHRSRRDGRA